MKIHLTTFNAKSTTRIGSWRFPTVSTRWRGKCQVRYGLILLCTHTCIYLNRVSAEQSEADGEFTSCRNCMGENFPWRTSHPTFGAKRPTRVKNAGAKKARNRKPARRVFIKVCCEEGDSLFRRDGTRERRKREIVGIKFRRDGSALSIDEKERKYCARFIMNFLYNDSFFTREKNVTDGKPPFNHLQPIVFESKRVSLEKIVVRKISSGFQSR